MVQSVGMSDILHIGAISPAGGTILAPMAGVTDLAFRTMAARLGAAVTVTEMVSSRALNTRSSVRVSGFSKRPLSASVARRFSGNDPEIMAQAAQLALRHSQCDFLDINMGCPMPKIVNNGDGSALMKDPQRAGRIVRAVVDAVPVPVTVRPASAGTGAVSMW